MALARSICSCFCDSGIEAEIAAAPTHADISAAPTKSFAVSPIAAAAALSPAPAANANERLRSERAELNRRAAVDALFSLVDKSGDGRASRRGLQSAVKVQAWKFKQLLGLGTHLKDSSDKSVWYDVGVCLGEADDFLTRVELFVWAGG